MHLNCMQSLWARHARTGNIYKGLENSMCADYLRVPHTYVHGLIDTVYNCSREYGDCYLYESGIYVCNIAFKQYHLCLNVCFGKPAVLSHTYVHGY